MGEHRRVGAVLFACGVEAGIIGEADFSRLIRYIWLLSWVK